MGSDDSSGLSRRVLPPRASGFGAPAQTSCHRCLHVTGNSSRALTAFALATLLGVFAINLLSAHIRLAEAGIGCTDWPTCYAHLGGATPLQGESRFGQALVPAPWAKRLHRLLATALVVLVIVLLLLQWSTPDPKRAGMRTGLLMAAVLVLLAVVGPLSFMKTRPAIAAVNLLGGLTLVALAFRIFLVVGRVTPPGVNGVRRLISTQRWVRVGLLALMLQLALGAWTSANFAASHCPGLGYCQPPALSGELLSDAFSLRRELALDATGHVRHGDASQLIAATHRVGAAVCGVLLLTCCIVSARRGVPLHVVVPVAVLLCAQVGSGLFAVGTGLPLGGVVVHGAVASLLLLSMLRLDQVLQHTVQQS